MDLVNRSPFAAERFLLADTRGADTLAVVVKATYALPARGEIRLAEEQLPVQPVDAYAGEPGRSSIVAASDLCPEKPGCDLILRGSAMAPRGQTQVDVSFRVGRYAKRVRVFGPRSWSTVLGMTRISSPRPFDTLPLTWEHAFGGVDETPDEPSQREWEPRNPVGLGFRARHSRTAVDGQPLPSIEDPDDTIRTPKDRPAPAGFGFVAPAWEPRRRFAGTYDERWQRERWPLLPADFDPRYHDRAPSTMVATSPPKAGDPVEVTGVRSPGRTSFSLPAVQVRAWLLSSTDRADVELRPHTIVVDTDRAELQLTFGGSRCVQDRIHRIAGVLVEADAW